MGIAKGNSQVQKREQSELNSSIPFLDMTQTSQQIHQHTSIPFLDMMSQTSQSSTSTYKHPFLDMMSEISQSSTSAYKHPLLGHDIIPLTLEPAAYQYPLLRHNIRDIPGQSQQHKSSFRSYPPVLTCSLSQPGLPKLEHRLPQSDTSIIFFTSLSPALKLCNTVTKNKEHREDLQANSIRDLHRKPSCYTVCKLKSHSLDLFILEMAAWIKLLPIPYNRGFHECCMCQESCHL